MGRCVGQQQKAVLTSLCDLQWEMQQADVLVIRGGLRRGVAREEGWSVVNKREEREGCYCSETAIWPQVLKGTAVHVL